MHQVRVRIPSKLQISMQKKPNTKKKYKITEWKSNIVHSLRQAQLKRRCGKNMPTRASQFVESSKNFSQIGDGAEEAVELRGRSLILGDKRGVDTPALSHMVGKNGRVIVLEGFVMAVGIFRYVRS